MKHLFLFVIAIYLLIGCKSKQEDKIITRLDSDAIHFDISLIDTLIKQELLPVDTSFFNKYIAKNPVILGENFESPRLYADGFWIKKYADSIKHNVIFNTFKNSKYYILPDALKPKEINGFLIMVFYPPVDITIEQHLALYLITLDNKDSYPSTVLLAEKIKIGGESSIDEVTTSVLKDSSLIEQKTIWKACILDIVIPNKGATCIYDTTTTFYKLTDRKVFYPYKKNSNWEIKDE